MGGEFETSHQVPRRAGEAALMEIVGEMTEGRTTAATNWMPTHDQVDGSTHGSSRAD